MRNRIGNMSVIAALRAIKGWSPLVLLLVAPLGVTGCDNNGEPIPVYTVGDDTGDGGGTDTDSGATIDTSPSPETGDSAVDVDGDGYADDDCDDSNANVHPGAAESCNGMDDDCDGTVDNGVTATWYLDGDQDGYGDAARTATGCTAPTTDYVALSTDCDDGNASVHPGATEVCDDANVDENCDGAADGSDATGSTLWFADADGDSYGDPGAYTFACDVPAGYTDNLDDCDDADSTAHPGGTEVCDGVDNDCSGDVDNDATDAPRWCLDADGDGYGGGVMDTDACTELYACEQPAGYVDNATDCDDTRTDVSPRASEVCDGADNDCNGSVDESSATDAPTWYLDRDSDGYGDSSVFYAGCVAPGGYVSDATDCNDADSTAFPGGTEVCDGVDNDCSGDVDNDATDAGVWYADNDGDSYGNASSTMSACDMLLGYVADATDCNDASGSYHPGAAESDCTDPADYNCDGSVMYADEDGDSFAACEDCDDSRTDVNPDAVESCNGRDDDCDGSVDGSNAVDVTTWYYDADEDGYGTDAATIDACNVPTGYAASDDDCDDGDAAFHPGAAESDCTDPSDYNCDGSVGYADADKDGYAACVDCDDSEAAANAGEVEVCDGIDNNCSGTVDESDAVDAGTWYADDDGDGYGNPSVSVGACGAPAGYVASATDCDDSRGATNPGADEYCNSVDDDCDGSVDESDAVDASTWYYDGDSDGYGADSSAVHACAAPVGYIGVAGDCDDAENDVNPGMFEICDDVYAEHDENCNGLVDDADPTLEWAYSWYPDADADGQGRLGATPIVQCEDPSVEDGTGYVGNDTDCDDHDDDIYLGAPEIPGNGVDEDCDGVDLPL